jgi:hypothetical protein
MPPLTSSLLKRSRLPSCRLAALPTVVRSASPTLVAEEVAAEAVACEEERV